MIGSSHRARIPSGLPLAGSGYGGARLFWMPDEPPTSRVAYAGAPQTIGVMCQAALTDANHFVTRELAEMVCEGLESKDYTSEYVALYHFLLQRTRYMRDPRRTELVRAPYIISRQIMAGHRPSLDCDDMATWLAAAVMSVGGRAEFCTVAFARLMYGDQPQYSHVFTRALEPRTRCQIVLDPVAAERTPQMLGRIKQGKAWPVSA